MKNKDEIKSFNHAVSGIIAALKTEGHMKTHYFAALLVIFLSLFFNFTRIEFITLALTIGFVIVAEMFNTCIELIVDKIYPEYNPKAKLIKDMSAGAVLIAAIVSVVVGYLLFFDKISDTTISVIDKVKKSPFHLSFIAVVLIVFFVLGIKTKFSKGHGTYFKGGKISGHSALAFCVATITALLVDNFLVILMSFFLAALVAESRVESEIHSIDEVVLGAVLGVITAILIFKIFAGGY